MLYKHVNLVEFLDMIRNEKRIVYVDNKVTEEYKKAVRILSGEFEIGSIDTYDYYDSLCEEEPYKHEVVNHSNSKVIRFSDDNLDGSMEDIEMPEGINEFFGVAEIVEMSTKYFEDKTKQEYITTEVIICVDS